MASKLLRGSSCAKAIKCTFGTVQPASSQAAQISGDGVVATKLSNNALILTAPDNDMPVSSFSFVYRSGARFENADNAGVSHLMRLCAGLKTKDISAFMNIRALQQTGSTLDTAGNRECIQYTLNGIVNDNVDAAFHMISQIAMEPLFRVWEIQHGLSRLKMENDKMTPSFILLDLLHRAAYQSKGLGRSLLTPDYMLTMLTAEDLMEFHASTHTTDRLSIVAIGPDNHHWLTGKAEELPKTTGTAQIIPSKYLGGEERLKSSNRLAYVAVVGEGASISSENAVPLLVAKYILGGETIVKYGVNAYSTVVGAIVGAGATGEVLPININYSDGGLFGFCMAIEPNNVEKATKEAFSAFKNLKITEQALEGAKQRAKKEVLMKEKDIESVCINSLMPGKSVSPLDQCDAINKVTISSVQKALKKVTSGKLSMSAYGNIENVPYLQFL